MRFQNEPLLELRRGDERSRLTEALAALDCKLPIDVPVIVEGAHRQQPSLDSCDPGTPERVVAHATVATQDEVEAAVSAAQDCALSWGRSLAGGRAAALTRAAAELRSRRYELAALAVRECAKPWAEADADVCEAIDFLVYYAREAVRLESATELEQLPGERNELRYRPRGVVAVIAPWNFPLAIAAGMTSAALASGNAVCLKPAEQSPACALALVQALHRAGVPSGALALPARRRGGGCGARSPIPGCIRLRSQAQGPSDCRSCAKLQRSPPGQRHLKRVVADGRQELRDRRRRRRSGRGGAGVAGLRVRLRGAEVLSRLARTRARAHSRAPDQADDGRAADAARRSGGDLRHRRAASDRGRRPGARGALCDQRGRGRRECSPCDAGAFDMGSSRPPL